MYGAVLAAFERLDLAIEEVETHYGGDFFPRTAPEGGVLFSYHSIGDSRNVWRIKETPVPYFYNIDRLGYSGWSELSVNCKQHLELIEQIDSDEAERFCKGISEWLRSDNLSKYAQNNDPLPVDSNFVFFPLQVRSDAVAVHNRIDPLRVLRRAAFLARKHKKILVVKRHPFDTSKMVRLSVLAVEKVNPYVLVTNASVASILPACDAVIVGNSGVGLEGIIHGKPVHSFASSEYDSSSFRINELSDLDDIFSKGNYMPHPLSSRFVDYFLRNRCFDARNADDVAIKFRSVLQLAQ